MRITIIGLSRSGKTTIFNALTGGRANVGSYSPSLTPNIGVAKVSDPRLPILESIFQPKKTVPAEINYVDMTVSLQTADTRGEIKGELLNYLTAADALLQVVRSFEDGNLPHPEGSVDSKRDIATMDLELAFSDLVIIQRRLDRLEVSLKGAKAQEHGLYLKEQMLLQKIKPALENEIPIRQQNLSEDELKALSNYQFLTAKPMLIILNIGENQISQASQLEEEIRSIYPQFDVTALCGKLELELSQLSEAESAEFRQALGLAAPALYQVIALSYRSLGLISFFTTASAELKAWTIPRGIVATRAAGKIHSDMERGFIRAEVINHSDLEKCGNLAEARKKGLLRVEGKNYVIQDGDVITFLFNI